MFPAQPDPTGDPNNWTREELRRWLAAVGSTRISLRWASLDGADSVNGVACSAEESSPTILGYPRAASGEGAGKHEDPSDLNRSSRGGLVPCAA